MDTKKLENLDYKPECSLCHGSGFDPGRSTCKTQYVADVPCPKCTKPTVAPGGCPECNSLSGTHCKGCSHRTVTITAQHAASLAALVTEWKGMIKLLKRVTDVDRGGLTCEYCDEMLEDLKYL